MLPWLSRLIRNQTFQDSAAILRGAVRVIDGLQPQQSFLERPSQTRSSIDPAPKERPIEDIATQHVLRPPSSISGIDGELKSSEFAIQQPLSVSPASTGQDQNQPYQSENKIMPFVELKENHIPESALSRAFQFSQLGLNLTANAVKAYVGSAFSSKKVSFKEALVSKDNASLLAKGLCKMRGAPLKLAQALSIQEDEVIPEHIRRAFEQARQSADVMPQAQLERMLEQELGSSWSDHFKDFNLKPFAAASIGQVHQAVLKNGQNVAVKVQYAGVKESIDSDLNNLKMLMDYSNLFPKTMFLDKLIANTRRELHEECDYLLEASKQRNYRRLFADQREYAIPQVIDELTTTRVLTSEFLYGDSLDLIADRYSQSARNEIGRRIMFLTLQELFRFRVMQTDPNPSNFYFDRENNKLILLDFGAVHEYSKEFIDNYIAVIHGAATNNRQVCLQKSVELGFLTGEESIRMKEAHIDSIITVGEPFSFDGQFDFGQQQMTKKIYELMPVMLKYRLRPPPAEIYSLHRKLSGAYLMNIKLRTKVDCKTMFMKLYRQYQKQI